MLLAQGQLVERDEAKAALWFEWAAKQGHAGAQERLARMHLAGVGVAQDARRGLDWLRKAAAQGVVRAQLAAVAIVEHGLYGLEVDRSEAAKWYRAAAERGEVSAQVALARMHHQGDGAPANILEAMRWYEAAAEQGNVDAQLTLALMHLDTREVPFAQPQHAFAWMKKAADQDDSEGQFGLGLLYLWGVGVEPNAYQAVQLLHKAATQGVPEAGSASRRYARARRMRVRGKRLQSLSAMARECRRLCTSQTWPQIPIASDRPRGCRG